MLWVWSDVVCTFEMEEPPTKKSRVHFGSLEEQEKKRINDDGSSLSSAVQAGIRAGNINIDTGKCAIFRSGAGK